MTSARVSLPACLFFLLQFLFQSFHTGFQLVESVDFHYPFFQLAQPFSNGFHFAWNGSHHLVQNYMADISLKVSRLRLRSNRPKAIDFCYDRRL